MTAHDAGLLTQAIQEFHWMARRYCDGRMSTAPGSFNNLVRQLRAAGIVLREPLYARDGMGRSYDGLTDAEAMAAQQDMPKGHAALEAEWRQRTEAMVTALSDLVRTFQARPDMLQLCGFQEHEQIKAACHALNQARVQSV